jgi:hypothetical protein
MPRTVDEAIRYSTAAHGFIWSQLQITAFPSNPRFDLVLAYVAIALEHQHAIINLVGLRLIGSALALFRPQVETTFRGLWVNLIASDEQVNAISHNGEEPFPRFRQMATELDTQYRADGWLARFADRWASLNGYTHSGLEQLGRRFRDDGNIAPNYPDEMISELVTSSGTVSIGFLAPVYRSMGFDAQATALEEWLDQNGTTEEGTWDSS